MIDDGKLHFSTLKNISTTPKHYKYFSEHDREDTDSFLIGRATHALVLQGIAPTIWDGRRSGAAYEQAVADNGGDDILNATQGRLVFAMANAITNSRTAQDVLRDAPHREESIQWRRGEFYCAGRVDAFGTDSLVELKTAKSANPYRFKREAGWYRYPEQMAWYDIGLGTKNEGDATQWRTCYIIVVENNGPVFPVSVFRVTPLRLLQANANIDEWLAKLERCQREKHWPGWDESVEDIDCEIEVNNDDEEEV